MDVKKLDPATEKKFISAQKNEITAHFIYGKLSRTARNSKNREILAKIAGDELKHKDICLYYTCREIRPSNFKIWIFYFISLIFGFTFGLKLMERSETKAVAFYSSLAKTIPESLAIAADEAIHEQQLVQMISDERVDYLTDMVRGLNAAIVELTGTLAGLTLAFLDRAVIIPTGIIIIITMSLAVSGTEYVATKTGVASKSPLKSFVYTGIANLIAAILLLLPYFLLSNLFIAVAVMIIIAMLLIAMFSYYISVISVINTKRARRLFLETAAVSLGIAAIAFGIGLLANNLLHIQVH